MEVTITDLENLTGITFKALKKRLDRLEPIRRSGSKIFYDARNALPLVFQARNGNELELEMERARLAAAQANKTELEYLKLAGKLVDADELKVELSKSIMGARAKLLALPRKVALQVTAMTSVNAVEDEIEKHIYQALTELSENAGRDEYKDIVSKIFSQILERLDQTVAHEMGIIALRELWLKGEEAA